MSRTRTIGGKLFEKIGGDYNIYSEGDITYNSNKSINFTAENGVTFGKPKAAPPANLATIYVKVRLKDPANYKGEFGFDWVDADLETKDIQKIQGVDFANVDYFYKEPSNPAELGNIVEKSTNESSANTAIKAKYEFNSRGKHIDLPYVLIKPLQEITLSIEVNRISGTITDDEIAITGDEFYEFEIVGGEKNGKIAKKKLTDGEKEILDLKIKCLAEAPKQNRYEFSHSSSTTPNLQVGGVVVMENKVLKLKFRVIALVSADASPSDKAKALFKKFKDNDIKKYLNENSLNQAGYEVEIENQAMFDAIDTADLDDYFYAFDKADWKTKNLFKEQYNKKYWGKVLKPDGTYELEPDGKHYKMVLTDNPPKPQDVITEDEDVDTKTFDFYKEKLKSKSKSYEGGIILLTDYESPKQTSAFSRTSPLNHYGLFVYQNGVEKKDIYAHEIGHMLGLPHFFYTDKEKEAYKDAKENILGNNEPEFVLENGKRIRNKNYMPGINKEILIAENKDTKYEMTNAFYSDKKALTTYLNNFIAHYQGKLKTTNYDDASKANINTEISKNQKAIRELTTVTDCSYKKYNLDCYLLKNDYIKHLKRKKQYLKDILEQVELNVLFFKQNTTGNFMDYYNSRLRFNCNQIKIMRDDSKNFIEEFCKCKTPIKKK